MAGYAVAAFNLAICSLLLISQISGQVNLRDPDGYDDIGNEDNDHPDTDHLGHRNDTGTHVFSDVIDSDLDDDWKDHYLWVINIFLIVLIS